MTYSKRSSLLVSLILIGAGLAPCLSAETPPQSGAYRLLKTEKVGGEGGFDYVYADADGRSLYIPRGNRVTVYDLDTLKSLGEIPKTERVHGVAVDPKSHHGFSSSKPVVMWDTKTMTTVKTIDVQGNPDGILFDPATERVHPQPCLAEYHCYRSQRRLDPWDGGYRRSSRTRS